MSNTKDEAVTGRLSAEREAEARAMLDRGEWFAVYPATRALEDVLVELDAVRSERDEARAENERRHHALVDLALKADAVRIERDAYKEKAWMYDELCK